MLRWIPLLLLITGCNDARVLVSSPIRIDGQPRIGATVPAAATTPDAGPGALVALAGPLGPPCCDAAGQRTTSADCTKDGCSCTVGVLCACQGTSAAFLCSDYCGSDAFVDPLCTESGWACAGGLIRTDSCAMGTCWGEPGDCCLNPRCVDGQWQCDAIADGGCW